MAQFRKRPVVIEARQWTGDNEKELLAWAGEFGWGGRLNAPSPDSHDRLLQVHTLEDVGHGAYHRRDWTVHYAYPGDWIIRGVNDEFYPCKPDIFAATYEPVSG